MIHPAQDKPLLTLLFPLYKSKQFIGNLRKHFDRFSDPRFNFIVSDRHCFDDCLAILKEEYRHDPRFSFHAATDNIGWVPHYNFMMKQVTGKYFAFVPHDDEYRPEYFDVLTKAMENKPSASMAFSLMHVAGENDWVPDYTIFRGKYAYPYSSEIYFRLLYSNIIGVAFRGVFRSEIVLSENLMILENEQVTMFQDYYWIFALLERGEFVYTEETSCTKNFRKKGASGDWDYKKFFKTNPAAREILYKYTMSSPLPITTRLSIYTGLRLRVIKAAVGKSLRKKKLQAEVTK